MCSLYAQCARAHSAEAPGLASQHKEPTGHAKPAGHALLLSASLQVKPSGHRSGMAQSTHEWGVVSVTVRSASSVDLQTFRRLLHAVSQGGGGNTFREARRKAYIRLMATL